MEKQKDWWRNTATLVQWVELKNSGCCFDTVIQKTNKVIERNA